MWQNLSKNFLIEKIVVEKHWKLGKQFIKSIYHPWPRQLLYVRNERNECPNGSSNDKKLHESTFRGRGGMNCSDDTISFVVVNTSTLSFESRTNEHEERSVRKSVGDGRVSTRLIEKYSLSELTRCRNHRIQMDSFRSPASFSVISTR